MNKSELVNSLSEETTFSKKDVVRLLDCLVRVVQRTLKSGDKVQWAGFGTWILSRRSARRGINPATKVAMELPAVNVPRFKAGKVLKEACRVK